VRREVKSRPTPVIRMKRISTVVFVVRIRSFLLSSLASQTNTLHQGADKLEHLQLLRRNQLLRPLRPLLLLLLLFSHPSLRVLQRIKYRLNHLPALELSRSPLLPRLAPTPLAPL
jgi:hypothetical protein